MVVPVRLGLFTKRGYDKGRRREPPAFVFLVLAASLLCFSQVSVTRQSWQRSSQDDLTQTNLAKQEEVFLPLAVRIGKTGERINIFDSGPQSFPAGSPFHIVHGWEVDPEDKQNELFGFKLQLNGVYLEEDFIELSPVPGSDPPLLSKRFIFNFPEGMTGVHTFTGHWLGPCSFFYEDCTDPDEIVEERTTIVEVTFGP